jgi:hypothetical protein
MQFVRAYPKRNQWQRFWPTTFLALIAMVQLVLIAAIIGIEFWSMIINIKYAFFFIGFITSFFFVITWISTFTAGKYLK